MQTVCIYKLLCSITCSCSLPSSSTHVLCTNFTDLFRHVASLVNSKQTVWKLIDLTLKVIIIYCHIKIFDNNSIYDRNYRIIKSIYTLWKMTKATLRLKTWPFSLRGFYHLPNGAITSVLPTHWHFKAALISCFVIKSVTENVLCVYELKARIMFCDANL